MSYDMFQSRRGYENLCYWWSRKEEDPEDSDELNMKRTPNGHFSAKEVSPESDQSTIAGGVFRVHKTTMTIKTPDNVWGMKEDDIVKFDGEYWIVTQIQRSKAKMQNTIFANSKNCSHFWYIDLRK